MRILSIDGHYEMELIEFGCDIFFAFHNLGKKNQSDLLGFFIEPKWILAPLF